MLDLDEIKSRINPAYADVLGTESHERKLLCDEIERLRKERDTFKAAYLEQVELHNLTLDDLNRYRAVMELALSMLDHCNKHGWMLADYETQMYEALTALREALEEEK